MNKPSKELVDAYQMNPEAKYLFKIEKDMPLEHVASFEKHLKAKGIDAIVVCGDFEIYELKSPVS